MENSTKIDGINTYRNVTKISNVRNETIIDTIKREYRMNHHNNDDKEMTKTDKCNIYDVREAPHPTKIQKITNILKIFCVTDKSSHI